MAVEQILQKEINKSEIAWSRNWGVYIQARSSKKDWTIKLDFRKYDIYICEFIETKMYEIIDIINQTDSVLEADPLHSELRILDWILYQVCINGKINFPG